jgi:inhibitor of KinA
VFSDQLDLEINLRIQRLAEAVNARQASWVRDVVPSLGSLALHIDRTRIQRSESPTVLAQRLLAECLAAPLPDLERFARTVELPVCYTGEFAPDMEDVASRCSLSAEEVIRRHSASAHRVLMVGFVPGHPYIGGSHPSISVPRRATPRQRVSRGSIAIANAQTVVYPFDSPSGWSIIGRTSERIFDPSRSEPSLMRPGDEVKFIPITRTEFNLRDRDT